MPIYTPKKITANWYRYDVSFSAELIKTFVESIERQASESIVNYKEKKQIVTVNDNLGESHLIEVHEGIDDETWDLTKIFCEYFPSLQRRSALLTVCSYFEHELDKLCWLYQSEKGFVLTPSDLKDNGIVRSINYLEKVARLNVHRSSPEWNAIKHIQELRNAIVHRGAKLRDKTDNSLIAFMDKMNGSLYRDDDNEIGLGAGFLSYVAGTYMSYFKLIADSINNKA